MHVSEITSNKGEVCEQILRSLPDWFGIEDAILKYIQDVQTMPMFGVRDDDKTIAFVSLNQHSDNAAEIHVMGVQPEHHRKGLGKLLVDACEQHLKQQGTEFLTVKTLSPSHESEEYSKTRRFYEALGFKPLEEFKTLWGEANPCLFMAKSLISPARIGDPKWRPPVLETERLILRPLKTDDAPAIFQYAKNPKVSLFTLWEPHQDVKDAIEFIEEYAFELYSQKTPEPMGITLKDKPNTVIGTVGCFWVSKSSRSMELAYAIDEQYWGKGLVVEASRQILHYVFENFDVERIQARCKVENKASARVMEKLNMKFEGTLRKAIFHRNRFWDMHYYSVLKEDWK